MAAESRLNHQRPDQEQKGPRLSSLTASACWYLSGLHRSLHSQSESAHRALLSERVPRSRHHKLILEKKKTKQPRFLPGFHARPCSSVADWTRKQTGKWAVLSPDDTQILFPRQGESFTVLTAKRGINHKLVTDLQNWRISFRIRWQRIR